MRNILSGNTYNGYELSNSSKNNQGFYVEILQVIESLFNYMTMHHGKVFFIRFDLRYPANSALTYRDDNVLLTRFIESLTLYYKRKKADPKYLWVREHSNKTGQFHYHFLLLLNGDLIWNGYGIKTKATDLWRGCLDLSVEAGSGLVHLCEYNDDQYGGIKINRNDPHLKQVFEKCYQRASYLAKRYSKGGLPPYVNGFGCSRIPFTYTN